MNHEFSSSQIRYVELYHRIPRVWAMVSANGAAIESATRFPVSRPLLATLCVLIQPESQDMSLGRACPSGAYILQARQARETRTAGSRGVR